MERQSPDCVLRVPVLLTMLLYHIKRLISRQFQAEKRLKKPKNGRYYATEENSRDHYKGEKSP
jgi:hypothetical protein